MIHETLLFLWNCPGDFLNKDNGRKWLKMQEFKCLLHPGEKCLLEKIVDIALDYHEIQLFIRNESVLNASIVQSEIKLKTDSELSSEGLYLQAFRNGLDEVLKDYRNDILRLENVTLADPKLPLSFILGQVNKYVGLFAFIKFIIQTIKTENLRGCLLLGKLHNYYYCGDKIISLAVSKVIQFVNAVFYRQLSNWIIFGDLVDVYQEFFICDAKCPDKDFLYFNTDNDGKYDLETFNESLKKFHIKRPAKVRKFYIKENMLPSFVSMELAQRILFMGRMVWIIRNDPKGIKEDEQEFQYKRNMWDEKEEFYFQKLQQLGSKPFNLAIFEKVIEECRLQLTKYLWNVMVEEAKLFHHLQLIRDYFALGRGELFQQFIILSEETIAATLNDHHIFKLNTILYETAKKLYSDVDKTYQRFEIILPANYDSEIKSCGFQIEMNIEIMWPLHIIFHPGAMSLYNKLFCFLLRVKKVQIDLQRVWTKHMNMKLNSNKGVWNLRNTLTFLINNLQYYLQVDVIETQFSVLQKNISNAKSVEDIIEFHTEFLGNLMSRTFLMTEEDKSNEDQTNPLYKLPSLNYSASNPVYNTIMKILQLCEIFCSEAANWEPVMRKVDMIQLGQLQSQCDTLVLYLLNTLYQLREHTSGNHLSQLLHQIDFNRWFSKDKPDFNISV